MAKNYAGITDTGKRRTNNEDTFIVTKLHRNLVTACVIDGLGGYEGGEVAAAVAKEAIISALLKPALNIPAQLVQALLAANERIQEERRNRHGVQQMACVVTLALADTTNNKLYYAHVGDTRLYLLRDNSLVKITEDQSFVGFLEDNGRISEEEAMAHPKRNEINKALGFDAFINATEYFDTGESPFLPGDMIMLCSDGLSDLVNNAKMTAILTGNGSLDQKVAELVAAANEAGGNDNITAVLVQHDKKPVTPHASSAGSQKKNTAEPEMAPHSGNIANDTIVAVQRPRNSAFTNVLLVILVFALGVIGWLLLTNWQREGTDSTTIAPVTVKKPNAAEQALADSFQFSAVNEILIERKASDAAVNISDTIFINRDTLIFHGNGLKFKADSGYYGPTFLLGEKCRYVLLDSITFEGFSSAIISKQNNLYLKKVQFINCSMPVLYAEKMPDSSALNGSLINHQFQQDSIPTNLR